MRLRRETLAPELASQTFPSPGPDRRSFSPWSTEGRPPRPAQRLQGADSSPIPLPSPPPSRGSAPSSADQEGPSRLESCRRERYMSHASHSLLENELDEDLLQGGGFRDGGFGAGGRRGGDGDESRARGIWELWGSPPELQQPDRPRAEQGFATPDPARRARTLASCACSKGPCPRIGRRKTKGPLSGATSA